MPKTVNVNKNQVAKKEKEMPTTMMGWIKGYEDQIAKALPSVMTPERFSRIAMTAVTQNPELGRCTPRSFIGALLTAAQLGLEPNTPLGQAYLIPFKNGRNGGALEAQFQLGYRGLIELAHRSGELKSIEAHIVYENDEFEYELGLDPKLRHIPAMRDRGGIAWVYAIYHLNSGGFGFEVMSFDDIEAHKKKYSKAASKGFSPWQTSREEMAKKTVIKRVLKYAPLKTDFIRAMREDESTLNFSEDDGSIIQDTASFDEENIVDISEDDVEVREDVGGEPKQAEIDTETGEIKQ
ncbi:MAG: recombinase RecT [Clostridiales bacterium]|nr:recombinase RecT [Clostridiales bacterium]